MLTCREFLQELGDYLDDACDPSLKKDLELHLSNCPNCWVVTDTTKRTIEVYHGHGREARPVPDAVKNRLLAALQRKMAERKGL